MTKLLGGIIVALTILVVLQWCFGQLNYVAIGNNLIAGIVLAIPTVFVFQTIWARNQAKMEDWLEQYDQRVAFRTLHGSFDDICYAINMTAQTPSSTWMTDKDVREEWRRALVSLEGAIRSAAPDLDSETRHFLHVMEGSIRGLVNSNEETCGRDAARSVRSIYDGMTAIAAHIAREPVPDLFEYAREAVETLEK